MITKKKLQKIAKVMYKNSFSGQFIDPKKVKRNLLVIAKEKPQGSTKILTIYKQLLEKTLSQEEIVIESPQKLSSKDEKELLKKTGARKIVYKISPVMVFGAKIKTGDWIFENGLDSRIQALTNLS